MSRQCFFCEKGVVAGGHRKHKYGGGWAYRAQRTTRKFKTNLTRITIEKAGKVKKVDICMKCYKKLRKQSSS
jgi:ribosomal protein L28